MTALMIFRRDLRVADNTALAAAAKHPQGVIPLFVLDEALLQRWQAAHHRLRFMAGCLKQLAADIRASSTGDGRLYLASGDPARVLESLLRQQAISEVHINADYTPKASRRDKLLKAVCDRHGIPLVAHSDQLLHEPGAILKSDGSPYTIFTPWYRRASQLEVRRPLRRRKINFAKAKTKAKAKEASGNPDDLHTLLSTDLPQDWQFRDAAAISAKPALKSIARLGRYPETREQPGIPGTSRLSAHLRFGTCSIRQVHETARQNLDDPSSFIRQLHWRDFYHQIGFHFPHVYAGCFRHVYDRVQWDEPGERLEQWRLGETGFPIVDAGMRELRSLGCMHNRVRMITASFLTKNLHIDWRLGEAHFARYLIDYDPALNNGNWQWSASTGCDAQPWFRIFNPWLQQKKFDPEASYIKEWVPELAQMSAGEIHRLKKNPEAYRPQITDLKASAEESKRRFRLAASS